LVWMSSGGLERGVIWEGSSNRPMGGGACTAVGGDARRSQAKMGGTRDRGKMTRGEDRAKPTGQETRG
jgi:hypothetical protein